MPHTYGFMPYARSSPRSAKGFRYGLASGDCSVPPPRGTCHVSTARAGFCTLGMSEARLGFKAPDGSAISKR